MSKKTEDLLELHIIRHGKSSWDYSHTADYDRPLTEKGIDNVALMAKRFFGNYALPGLILASPANRALHTAIIYARELHLPYSLLQLSEVIYNSDEEGVLSLIHETPPIVKRLMLVGHNPAFTDLANHFLLQKIENLPTAGIVTLTFRAPDWAAITAGNIVNEIFDYPKKNH
jgi:phosphohistidine phosphatase